MKGTKGLEKRAVELGMGKFVMVYFGRMSWVLGGIGSRLYCSYS